MPASSSADGFLPLKTILKTRSQCHVAERETAEFRIIH
jgi:hypothetical protein